MVEASKKKSNLLESCRENPWIVSTGVLAIVVILLLIPFSSLTGNVVSEEKVASTFLSYLTSAGADINSVEVTSIVKENGLYKISFNYEGSEYPVPFYLTENGKMIGQMTLIQSSSTVDSSSDSCWEKIASELDFDIDKISSFAYSSKGINLLKEDSTLTSKYQITGSPTLMINNKKSSSIYSGTDAVKSSICSSFKNLPKECSGVNITQENLTKTDKPVVDLYVMSYCPYGVRAENNLAPLVKLFGNKVDFNIRFIAQVQGDSVESIDSLHGIKEAKEDLNQIAIMELYPEKFWDYLNEFNNVCYGGGASSSSGSC